MRIAYSPAARADLARMRLDYEARAGLRIADEMVGRITGTLQRVVATHPRVGRARPELGDDIRSFPVVPYVVFYRLLRSRIIVIRILHGRRDIHSPIVSLLARGASLAGTRGAKAIQRDRMAAHAELRRQQLPQVF